jgi:N-acyl-D-aspartate/D-glutamate deacylase
MLDLVITGGLIVDGSGAPSRRADVSVRDGRVVAVGTADEPARRTVDVDGLVVAPGFIDVHTHYDAQVFWDTTLSPSPLHGVTSVVGGNCGFSIAPLTGKDGDYLMRMLARVEGMPLESLQCGVPWDWRTTGEYLDRVDGTLAVNAGFMVGHSALRRVVMHDDAVGKQATPEQVDHMAQLLRDGLAAGALGFSSTWSPSHNDHEGRPVPSRHSTREELLALCAVAGEFAGTTLEFLAGLTPYGEDLFDVMAAMSRVANRPLNWNLLFVNSANGELVAHQLSGSDYAAERGGYVVALTIPDTVRTRLNFRSGFALDTLPGWGPLMGLPRQEKLAMMRDPSGRAEMDRLAQSRVDPFRRLAHWAGYTLLETFSLETKRFQGRTVGDVAAEMANSPWDALVDIVIADDLNTVITRGDEYTDDDTWKARVEAWRDPRTLVGASDAGAHLDMLDTYSYATTLLSKGVREHGLLPLEEAVKLLTADAADLYGLVGRGRIEEGAWADIVVLDPATVSPEPVYTRFDLPAGAGRLYGGAEGIHRVFVGGAQVVDGKEFTDERPGRVLRSGKDTRTVTAARG